ncbi:MAG: DUF3592 domain-containing protein [Beutenbergiaceae bacterium]
MGSTDVWLRLILTAVLALGLAFSAIYTVRAIIRRVRWLPTRATVTTSSLTGAFVDEYGGRRERWRTSVSYTDRDGRSRRARSTLSKRMPTGSTLELRYNPDDPKQTEFSKWRWLVATIVTATLAFLFAAALSVLPELIARL